MSEAAHHDDSHYWKIYYALLVLLVISVVGPFAEIWWLTLITAFGVAIVKAFLVCKHFMHLNIEARWVIYLLATMLVFMFLFFTAVAPDVMKWEGDNWVKPFVAQESSVQPH